MDLRRQLWTNLTRDWKIRTLVQIARQIPLDEDSDCIGSVLKWNSCGRVVEMD